MRALLVVCAAAACGDNALPDGVPLSPAHELVVVAHQDDDLLFIQPDLAEALRAGVGVTTVFVTAGDAGRGVDFAQNRYTGSRAAYLAAAGTGGAWSCGWIDVAGHLAEHCRLASADVSLVFLGYPDGDKEGQTSTSLLHLWQGDVTSVHTVADRAARYTRDGLIDALADVMRVTQPTTIRTLEVSATHDYDHSDHMFAGALTVLAAARAETRADLISYRGYNMDNEQVDKTEAEVHESLDALAHYEACAAGCAPCGQACDDPTIDPTHLKLLHHRYAIGFRRQIAGKLASGGQCVTAAADGTVELGDCATAQVWRLDDDRELRAGDHCLAVQPDNSLVAGDCIGGEDHTFFYDDEHHLWSGVAPAPATDMHYAHLDCLGDGAQVDLCGKDHAPSWEFITPVVVTPRSTLGLAATGRAVRLGDLTGDHKPDLCTLSSLGPMCAPGAGDGTFGPAALLASPSPQLIAEPDSLVIGDVDNDGNGDVCGRVSDGVACALSSTELIAVSWSTVFGNDDVTPGTATSLTAIDADGEHGIEICGVATEGVLCITRGAEIAPKPLSTWPDPAAPLWFGDLDGDGKADWCAQAATGPACATAAQHGISTDGAPWAYSLLGALDASATADASSAGLADIDGDGLADLCELDGDRVVCARSTGRGFSPRTTLATIPGGTALWLGDLDGDGKADACVDTGDAVRCALSP